MFVPVVAALIQINDKYYETASADALTSCLTSSVITLEASCGPEPELSLCCHMQELLGP